MTLKTALFCSNFRIESERKNHVKIINSLKGDELSILSWLLYLFKTQSTSMWCWDLSQIQIVFLVHIIFSNSLAVTKARLCASSYPTNGIEILFIHHSQSYLNKVVSFYFLNNAVVYWTVFTLRSLRRLHFWIGFYYQIQFMSASNGIVLHLMSYWNRVFMKCIQRVMFVIQYTCSHIHNLYQWSQCMCVNMHFIIARDVSFSWRNGNKKWNIFPLL